jgi:hypothetical protein
MSYVFRTLAQGGSRLRDGLQAIWTYFMWLRARKKVKPLYINRLSVKLPTAALGAVLRLNVRKTPLYF